MSTNSISVIEHPAHKPIHGLGILPDAATIPSLGPGLIYVPPDGPGVQCICNTVYYSMLSACSQCQEGEILGYVQLTQMVTLNHVNAYALNRVTF